MRILQQIGAQLISPSSSAPSSSAAAAAMSYYYALRPCAQIASDGVMTDGAIATLWPACLAYFTGHNPDQTVLVAANYGGTPIEANVALSVTAGPAGWIALLLHMFAVEIYVSFFIVIFSFLESFAWPPYHHKPPFLPRILPIKTSKQASACITSVRATT